MTNIEVLISNNCVKYHDSLQIMKNRVDDIYKGRKKELIWFLYHDHIFTQGTSASKSEIIKKTKIPIIQTNRGGKTTYHGPGQRIVYFLINLNERKKDIKSFIYVIENSLILLLKKYNIQCTTFGDRVGIWVTKNQDQVLKKEEKIGAIGLRLKKWVTYHGLSVNINPNLNYYNYINACGLDNFENTSLEKLDKKISFNEFDKNYQNIFLEELNRF